VGSRRRAREFALQALYHSDQRGQPASSALNALWSGVMDGDGFDAEQPAPESDEMEFAQRIVHGVEQRKDEIDELITQSSTNWRVARMPIVDRNILRMSAFELLALSDVPATVAINEAIELAKKYGAAESRKFVNGIVDRIARQLKRI
jgi:transcription antitermination protein NusB